mmetsp:Transcript_19286/g.22751  ORF Transcript_19286/g.22751 Transcript_19286/m.22751 type:complete len:122 (-) Transcript_19286:165-530(-)
MSLNTTRGHLMRALLEAPCLRTAEVVEAMEKDSGTKVESMAVDGGMTVNNLMMQTQADLIDAKIERKAEKEITGLGAAIAAGLKVGVWDSVDEIRSKIDLEHVFEPKQSAEWRSKKRGRFS